MKDTVKIPQEIMNEIKKIAISRFISQEQAFKNILKYGFLVYAIMDDPKSDLIIRNENGDQKVIE